jgi:hypothetical protein
MFNSMLNTGKDAKRIFEAAKASKKTNKKST